MLLVKQMKKCTILCNPSSGSNDKEKLIKQFKEVLKEHDYVAEVVYTRYSGHAKKIVASMENTDLLPL